MYKALIADVDGTLVPIKGDGSTIDSQTRSAVSKAIQNGLQFSVATGRGWASTKPLVKSLGIVDLCIIEGGACIIDPASEKIVWQKTMSADTSANVVAVFKQVCHDDELIKSSSRPDRVHIRTADDYRITNRVIYLLGATKTVAEELKSGIEKLPSVSANITTPSWAGDNLFDVHVTDNHGTKKYALTEWHRLMRLHRSETAAMGDSENDLPLFQAAAFRIAVGNSTNDLKEAADYVAPDIHHRALEDVLIKIVAQRSHE